MRQALISSALILNYVLITQCGRRKFSWHKWLPPAVAIPLIGVIYFRTAPATPADLALYTTAAAVGIAFGLLAARTTRLERDAYTRRLYTRCGLAFAVTWFIALGIRIVFVWGLQDSPLVRRSIGTFMHDHHIIRDAIAPTFVIIALTMFSVRLIALAIKARRIPVV
jgi:hypothetical protein